MTFFVGAADVRPATPADRPTVERLWLMFRHDLSEFRNGGVSQLPDPDGTFRSERVAAAFGDSGEAGGAGGSREAGDWAPYLFLSGVHPVGFAFVRGIGGPTRILNSFFVVRGARRGGVGMRAVRDVVARYPGDWEVAFQDVNPGAVAFWRRVGEELAPGAWGEERRPVPGRVGLPPDVWISFRYGGAVER
ncbi:MULTISPECIES: GNAT family N-acetyltransferase [unclassified Streptomyces]|uniref:GNAT family N-acetyltransferase n=1 Tax=unclassified Streptomyces TaxID=2593676 RepID=UPI002E2AEE25|nr:GNAT family N-acetyltransferase [Streptomyces sp. NBC_00228]